jgi:hypothetical protein
MLYANNMLGLAIAIANRMGMHCDGQHFNISPFQTEMRRRMWHHIKLLDTWCIENLGVEPLVNASSSAGTVLPQNSNDTAWDTSPFSASRPNPETQFTDMTTALMLYEIASFSRIVLRHSVPSLDVEKFRAFHSRLIQQASDRIEITYLRHLDDSVLKQKLARDVAQLYLRRIALTQSQILHKHTGLLHTEQPISEQETEYVSLRYPPDFDSRLTLPKALRECDSILSFSSTSPGRICTA